MMIRMARRVIMVVMMMKRRPMMMLNINIWYDQVVVDKIHL